MSDMVYIMLRVLYLFASYLIEAFTPPSIPTRIKKIRLDYFFDRITLFLFSEQEKRANHEHYNEQQEAKDHQATQRYPEVQGA